MFFFWRNLQSVKTAVYQERHVSLLCSESFGKEDINWTAKLLLIGARGYISKENRQRLKTIYTYCKKDIKLKLFEENIAKLSTIYGSYYIYLCRNQTEWATPSLPTVD